MCGTENRTQLPLAASASGCSCCTTEPSSTPTPVAAAAAENAEFAVEGLTCGHCVQSVEKAVVSVAGVESASVELVAGGRSRLIIGGAADETAVREAVTSAGYDLISH